MPPSELALRLRERLRPTDLYGHDLLNALLGKAERQDSACATCYEAAIQEGKKAALQEKG